jgi:DNA-binding protein H-NS
MKWRLCKKRHMEQCGIEIQKLNSEEQLVLVTEVFDLLSCKELLIARDRAQEKWQEKVEVAKSAAIEKMRSELSVFGLNPADITVSFERARRGAREGGAAREGRGVVMPKYKGPKGETWSGRGYAPKWLKDLEASGHGRQEYKIEEKGGTEGEVK